MAFYRPLKIRSSYSQHVPALRLDVDLSHPQDQVWRALTESGPLNEWFQPLTGWPETGATEGTVGHVFPTGELHSFAPFELELIDLRPPHRLTFRWRGEDFHSEATWEITPIGRGCRLSLRQTGFLGSQEALRRAELFDGYQLMLTQRLPAALDRLAGVSARVAAPPMPQAAHGPLGTENRLRWLSLAGALALVVLCASAAAVWINGSETIPVIGANGIGLGSGKQPGTTEPTRPSATASPLVPTPTLTPSRLPSPSGYPVAAVSGVPLDATYRTIALLGLGGFDTEVTVHNPAGIAHNGWTVVLTMPADNEAQNRSPDAVNLQQNGQTVTLTPVDAHLAGNGTVTFVIRFPALLALGKSITACTIDDRPCSS